MNTQDYETYDPSASVPNAAQKLSSKAQRIPYSGSGIYQKAREEEKKQLLDLMVNSGQLNQSDAGDLIYGIPNAKFGWANVFLKKAFNQNAKINPCDIQLFGGIWMSDKAKVVWNKIKDDLPAATDPNSQVTAKFPTKGGIQPTCTNGVLKANFKNPGVFNLYTNQMEHYPNMEDMYEEIREYNKYGDNIDYRTGRVIQPAQRHTNDDSFFSKDMSMSMNTTCTAAEDCACEKSAVRLLNKTDKVINQIDVMSKMANDLDRLHQRTHSMDYLDIPPHMTSLFANFRKALVEENIVDMVTLEKLADALKYLRGVQTSQYLTSICDPFTHRFVKAPSEIPIPSASFSVRTNINLSTNALGNVAFAFDPFYLSANTTLAPSSFGLNNAPGLDGTTVNAAFNAISVGQTLPASLYGKYRLVSAGLKLSVTSSYLNTTGFCTMGLQFDSGSSSPTNVSTPIIAYSPYSAFSLIENSYFKQQAPLRTGEVIQINYLPLDNTFLQFTSLGTGFKNCTFVGYATGAPANTVIGRLDLVLNFEGTVDLNWTDYIPQALAFESNSSIKYLPSVVNYLIDNNQSTSPSDMKNAVKNVIVQDDKKIYVTPSKLEREVRDVLTDGKAQLANNLSEQLKTVIEDPKIKPEIKEKAKDYLDILLKIAQFTPLAPLATGIQLARSIF